MRLSRFSAAARLGQAVQLATRLPETLQAWQDGRLDERKVAAICDATHYLDDDKARAVQDRVLGRVSGQTVARLKGALQRAVLAVDPEGAAQRHRRARRDRRVAVGVEREGMASLWALLAAPDARAAYAWLTRLDQGMGSDDPRGMDARRADLLAALLTGELTYAVDDTTTDDATVTEPDETGADDSRHRVRRHRVRQVGGGGRRVRGHRGRGRRKRRHHHGHERRHRCMRHGRHRGHGRHHYHHVCRRRGRGRGDRHRRGRRSRRRRERRDTDRTQGPTPEPGPGPPGPMSSGRGPGRNPSPPHPDR